MLFVGSIYLSKEEIFQKTIMYDTSMAIAVVSEVKSPLRFANFNSSGSTFFALSSSLIVTA